MVGDLGRDRALLGHVLRPWTVSRPGVIKARRPCVATQQVCCDRVPQRVRTSVHDRYSMCTAAHTTGGRKIRIHARPRACGQARQGIVAT